MTWRRILPFWTLLVADLAQVYHLRLREHMDALPFPDFRDLVFGLFGVADSRLRLAMFPPKPPPRGKPGP